MGQYYDIDGQPLDLMSWAKLFEDMEYRRVAFTSVDDSTISTVWLGLDHGWNCGPPVIFETLVMGGPFDGEMDRYHTLAEAKAGHEAMVARISAKRVVEN